MNPLTYFIGNEQKNKMDVVLGQNLRQIKSNVVKKVKKWALSSVYFTWRIPYLLKQEEVVVEATEWKFKANLARNATFERCYDQIITQFGSKMTKN